MKILIVGGTSALAQVLKPVIAEFAEVITAGRKDCDVHLNLSDPVEKMVLPQDCDVVINTAANFGGASFEEIYDTENVNVLGALKLCQACHKAQVRHLIQISSASALLDKTSVYYGIYALSKKHSDEMVELFCSSVRMPYTILRPSQLYGNVDAFRKHQPFVYAAIDKAQQGDDIAIYGTRDALRNYLYADDFARIVTQVIKQQTTGLYSCMNAVDVSLSQIANAAIDAFASGSKVSFLPEKQDIPDNVFGYDSALYKKIGCTPQIGIQDGMRKIAAFRLGKQ